MRKESLMVDWRKLCTIGGIAALMTVLVGLIKSSITFLPKRYRLRTNQRS